MFRIHQFVSQFQQIITHMSLCRVIVELFHFGHVDAVVVQLNLTLGLQREDIDLLTNSKNYSKKSPLTTGLRSG